MIDLSGLVGIDSLPLIYNIHINDELRRLREAASPRVCHHSARRQLNLPCPPGSRPVACPDQRCHDSRFL